jgi:membrane fusion protein, macrolide-specific efflux system
VTVATSGKLGGPTETRTVTTGITAGGQTEITSGLKSGEQVVLTLPAALGGFNRTGTGAGGGGGFGGTGGGFGGGGTRTGGSGG